ncbi:hypothetical protein [Phocaeicola sp.]
MTVAEFKLFYSSRYPQKEGSENLWSVAYQVYINAEKNLNNYCILGRLDDIKKILGEKKANEPLLVLDAETKNFYITNEHHLGNVLNSDDWTIGVNDAWVLGGVNGNSTFNFVQTKPFSGTKDELKTFIDNYIKGNGEHPTTVTAREILGLECAGYTPNLVGGALVFTPSSKPREMEISTYHTNTVNFQGNELIEEIRKYLSPVFNKTK